MRSHFFSTRSLLVLLPLASCFLLAGGAHARKIAMSEKVAPGGRASLIVVTGAIEVRTHPGAEILLSGTIGDDVKQIGVASSEGHVRFKLETKRNGRDVAANLVLQVPVGIGVEVKSVSAPIHIASAVPSAVLTAVGGDIRVDADVPELEVSTVSGDVTIKGATTRLTIETVSGDVIAGPVADDIEAKTVSGDVAVTGGPFGRATITTLSGEIELGGSVANDARLRLKSQSGDIHMRFPADTKARFKLRSFSGDVKNALAGKGASEGGAATSGRVEASTFSGEVAVEIGG